MEFVSLINLVDDRFSKISHRASTATGKTFGAFFFGEKTGVLQIFIELEASQYLLFCDRKKHDLIF